MSWTKILLFFSLITLATSCLKMIPPEEVGFSTTDDPFTTPENMETNSQVTVTEPVTEPATEPTVTQSTAESVTETETSTTAMGKPCMECSIADVLTPPAGKPRVYGNIEIEPTPEGYIQVSATCNYGYICTSIQVFAMIGMESVAIGNDDIRVSTALLTCSSDNTWSSGEYKNIDAVYCVYVGC